MRKNLLLAFSIAALFVFICLVAIWVLTMPSLFKFYDLSSDAKNNIASTINGITAPILGIFTSILLFITLRMQIQTTRRQNAKNDFDSIIYTMNKLEGEFEYFSLELGNISRDKSKPDTKEFFSGYEAFQRFVAMINTSDLNVLKAEHETLKYFWQANQILYIIKTYQTIESRISFVGLTSNITLLKNQHELFYVAKLKHPLEILIQAIDIRPHLEDKYSLAIREFVNEQNNTASLDNYIPK